MDFMGDLFPFCLFLFSCCAFFVMVPSNELLLALCHIFKSVGWLLSLGCSCHAERSNELNESFF